MYQEQKARIIVPSYAGREGGDVAGLVVGCIMHPPWMREHQLALCEITVRRAEVDVRLYVPTGTDIVDFMRRAEPIIVARVRDAEHMRGLRSIPALVELTEGEREPH